MRVAMYYSNSDVRLEEMPKPKISAGELLIEMKASGICGSDVMEWYRLKKAPLVLGHEATGEVVEVGEGVENFKIRDRVFVSHHVPCNSCQYCLNGYHTVCETLQTTNFYPGGFSEYIRVPKINVERGTFLLLPDISFEDGTFIEPLACVIRGQRQANFKTSQDVLILGSGISGILHLLLAKAGGARKVAVTDISQYRLDFAKELGADLAIDAKEDVSKKLQSAIGKLADLVIVCTGALAAFNQALKSVDKAGTILCFAPTDPGINLPVPVNDFWRNSITITHSYGASPQDLAQAIDLLSKKTIPVGKMITHRVGLKDAGLGFSLVAQGGQALKVIVTPKGS